MLAVRKAQRLLPIGIIIIQEGRIRQPRFLADAEGNAHLRRVGRSVFGINIQHTLDILLRAVKIAVLHEQVCALHQAVNPRCHAARGGLYHLPNRPGCFRLIARIHHLLHPAQQVLHEADFAHVLTLQHRQFFRQVVRIHIPIARNQQPLVVVLHQRQIAAPLVFHPHGVKVLRTAADNDHHLRAV